MSDDGYSSLEEDLAPNTQVHSHTASTSVIKNEPDALVGHGDSPPIAPISDGSSIGGNRAPLRDAGEKAGSEKSGSDGGTKKNSTQIDEKIFREIEERVHRRKLQRIKERQLGRQTGIDEELESMNDWREELVAYPSCEQVGRTGVSYRGWEFYGQWGGGGVHKWDFIRGSNIKCGR